MPDEKPGTLALRSARARRDDWLERQRSAETVGDHVLANEAAKFVAEYEDLIADLERKAAGGD